MPRAILRRAARYRRQAIHSYRSVRWRSLTHTPVFVVGAMGSGTSLLALSLASRFELAGLVYESALEVPARSFLRMAPLDSYGSVEAYEVAMQPRDGWRVDEARRHLQHVYRGHSDRAHPVIVDKGPNVHLVRAGFLAECFPEARFVLIVRNPVANIEGFRRKWPTFARAPVAESVGFYRRMHECFLDVAGERSLDVVAVAYESLVDRHEEQMAELGSRLGLSPRTEAASVDPRLGRKGIRNVIDGRIVIVPKANEEALRSIDSSEVALIRSELGDLHLRMLASSSQA